MREEHPYQGTASYFRNVQRQHMPHPLVSASLDAVGTGSAGAQQQRQRQQHGGEPGGASGGSEGWTLVEGGDAPAGAGAGPAALSAQQGGAPTGQGAHAAGDRRSEEELSQMVAVTCINLLHANPKKASELMLSSHFQDVRCQVVLLALLRSWAEACACCGSPGLAPCLHSTPPPTRLPQRMPSSPRAFAPLGCAAGHASRAAPAGWRGSH